MDEIKGAELVDIILELKQEFKNSCLDLQMTEKAFEKLLIGKEILPCPECATPNFYETSRQYKEDTSTYECCKCGKSRIINWKDTDNYYTIFKRRKNSE
jgi:hypothetical protein